VCTPLINVLLFALISFDACVSCIESVPVGKFQWMHDYDCNYSQVPQGPLTTKFRSTRVFRLLHFGIEYCTDIIIVLNTTILSKDKKG
jgi:hypothetical protein